LWISSTLSIMNTHHLELFYFVAKHGGIAGAVRNIPYGIQQPAVSGQIAKLEESLGTKLFQRRPFALSPAGIELVRAEELWKRDKIEETLISFPRTDPSTLRFSAVLSTWEWNGFAVSRSTRLA
jgi:DNA-binding transcriptional LysR family regulator